MKYEFLRDDELSEEFASISHGYTLVDDAGLRWIRDRLPKPKTKRERAIAKAIQFGLDYPGFRARVMIPGKFSTRPVQFVPGDVEPVLAEAA